MSKTLEAMLDTIKPKERHPKCAVPIHRLKAIELKARSAWICIHGHNGLDHPACWEAEHPNTERIGFLDIESNNLDADWGFMLTYCILDSKSGGICQGWLTPDDFKGDKEEDCRLVKNCIEDLRKFDRIVTFYGQRFDIPFIRTRALISNIPFPFYGSLKHNDLYFVARSRLKLSSNRLENVCRTILGETNKTRINGKYWRKASRGDKEGIQKVLEHNRYDVIDLEKAYYKLLDYFQRRDTSI